MPNVYFSADQHYNHSNVIKHMNRPYSSVEEMNEDLIAKHNEIVKPGDLTYHLGDFAWHDHNKFVSRLNGNHYLIRGNHDHVKRLKEDLKFIWVKDTHTVKYGNDLFVLSHFAHRVWNRSHYGSYHLYGHSHGMLPDSGRSTDVGVDAWGFYPVSVDQILERLSGVTEFMNHHPEEV